MYTFEDATREYYDTVVQILKEKHLYNDDVFQQTVEKCFNIFVSRYHEGKVIHPENVIKYFVSAYKRNLRRNKYYANERVCHFRTGEPAGSLSEDRHELHEPDRGGTHMDYVRLRTYFVNTFGQKAAVMLRLYSLGGYSIRELEEKFHETGLKYLFKKMKSEAREYFKGELYC